MSGAEAEAKAKPKVLCLGDVIYLHVKTKDGGSSGGMKEYYVHGTGFNDERVGMCSVRANENSPAAVRVDTEPKSGSGPSCAQGPGTVQGPSRAHSCRTKLRKRDTGNI